MVKISELRRLRAMEAYLIEVIDQIKEHAVEAETERRKDRSNEFNSGIAVGILQMLSTMQNQAHIVQDTLEIPFLKEIGLDDIDPEGDPLGEKNNNSNTIQHDRTQQL